jgi:hypothetical protein
MGSLAVAERHDLMGSTQSPGLLPKTNRNGGTRLPLPIRCSYSLDKAGMFAPGLSDIGTVDQGTLSEIELLVCHDGTQTLIAVCMMR